MLLPLPVEFICARVVNRRNAKTTQNIILKIHVIYNNLEQLYSGKKGEKISKRSRLRGSLEKGKATEPGGMPLMSLICPPVIEISTSHY